MKVKTIHNVRVGKAKASHDRSAHTRGVREGNSTGRLEKDKGFVVDGTTTGTARRSTGINPKKHGPIDPRMPNLSPS